MATTIDERCTLVRAFTEFELLPDLLARTPEPSVAGLTGEGILERGMPLALNEEAALESWANYLGEFGVNMDHAEPEDLPPDFVEETYMAEDAWRLAKRLGWVTPNGLSATGQRLAYIAERPLMRRTRADHENLIGTVARTVQEGYVGADDLQVVPLLQEGARILGETEHIWASYIPGLLLVEFEALIHWAFARPSYAVSLCDDLVTYRDVAMHRYDGPSPDVDPDENLRLHAEAVATLYLETPGLAARTDLTITEIRSTAMLLTFSGLLDEQP